MELREKILNFEVCRLCLNENSGELASIYMESSENGQKPRDLIDKFNLFKVSDDIPLEVICSSCSSNLKSFYEFHLKALECQEKICKILNSKEEECQSTQEVVIEFIDYENDCDDFNSWDDINKHKNSYPQEPRTIPRASAILLECGFCSKTYKRDSHLYRHISKHHQDEEVKKSKAVEKYRCKFCAETFDVNEFQIHFKDNSCVSSESPTCNFCNKIHPDIQSLEDHIDKVHHNFRLFPCPICNKKFQSVSNRNSHIESHNADNSVTCPDCNQGFKSILYLKKHQKSIHTKVEKTCELCNRKFQTQQKFDYHMKSHQHEKRYKCTECDKSFMQHHHLENHKATHSGVSRFLCFRCGKEFKQECNLKVHLQAHDEKNVESFKDATKSNSLLIKSDTQCPECGRKFTQRRLLRAHFRSHFRKPLEKTFKCTEQDCSRSFTHRQSINYHRLTVHGIGNPTAREESFSCEMCSKSFELQSLLKRHALTHDEDEKSTRKHQCEKCEAIFKRPEHLKLHVNSVHLKHKPYKCEKCDKSFAQIGDRNVHLKVHSDVKPFECQLCGKMFRLAKGLKAHGRVHEKCGAVRRPGIVNKEKFMENG